MATNFVPADFVYWEAVYDDGSSLREKDGGVYRAIERNKLSSFRIVSPDETVIFEVRMPDGLNGHNLVYRRRNAITEGRGRTGIILVGFIPTGPAWALDITNSTYLESPQGFIFGDPIFYPVDPMPGERYFEDQLATLNKEYAHLKEIGD